MLVNRNAVTDGTMIAPRPQAAPAVETVEKIALPARPLRLRVEEVEPRVAPNAIWGD